MTTLARGLRAPWRAAARWGVARASAAADVAACACCLSPPTSLEPARSGPRTARVPYCAACRRHAHAERTRWLAVAVASTLLGATAAAAIVLAAAWVPRLAVVGAAACSAALPWLALVFPRAAPGHAAAGAAAWLRRDGTLECASEAFAQRVDSAPRLVRRWSAAPPPWAPATPALAIAAALVAHSVLTADVRALALTGERLLFRVDGRALATAAPARGESPAAGVVVRVPVGRVRLEAVLPDGTVLDARDAVVESGRPHLYAPGDHGRCFWLETADTRAAGSPIARRPVAGVGAFRALPAIDVWFAPPPSPAGVLTTGGAVTALRQAPCAGAGEPGAVRELAPVPGRL